MTDIYTTDKKYGIILADPPWAYRVWSKKGSGRTAESHYRTMTTPDIRALPAGRIAAPDCALFMWATFPNLHNAFTVLWNWGFEYKTVAFTWVKRNRKSPGWHVGMGSWTRANAEVCLLATRGRPKRIDAAVRQVIESPVEAHSKKPDETRDRIVRLLGDLPRIELFARQRAEGWDRWGDEC